MGDERADLTPALLKSLLATAPAGIGFWDRELRFVAVNEALAGINGVAADAHVGRALREVLPRLAPTLEPLLRRVLETGEPVAETEVAGETPAEPGRRRHWQASYYPVRDEAGAIVGVGAVVQEVTERRAAEERRRFLASAGTILASSLDYETTLDSVARLAVPFLADWAFVEVLQDDGSIERLAIAHRDPDKEALAREYARRYPLDPEAPGGSAEVIRTGRPELLSEVPDALLQAVAQDPEHLRILRELGFGSSVIVPLRARGRILGDLAFATEGSGRRLGPDDLALAEELAHRAALAVDNARLYREAREAVRARDEFLSNVSHDLKTPLTGIRGLAELLGRRAAAVGGAEGEHLADGLGRIRATATRMHRQLDALVDATRLQLGQELELRRTPTDLVALVRQVVAAHQPTASRHRLEVEASDAALTGFVDPLRLEHALNNLLDNAIKYSPDGGIVTVAVARDEVEGRRWAVIRVADRGIGIPPADVSRLFERFHRGANAVGRIAGTGIGLASACQIVRQHGGSIDVESREGAGSTFTIRLPLSIEPAGRP